MRTFALTLAVLACAAAPAQAAKVDLMVVGKRSVLRRPAPVALKAAKVRVSGRTCRVAGATPLAVLARTPLRPKLRLEDFAACSRRPSEAAGLYVRGIGKEVERGTDGWVYKVGRKVPGLGAGDPAVKLAGGAQVLWFWCRMDAEGCQRTLAVEPSTTTAAPGETVTVKVTGYDDDGRGKPAAGATVHLGGATAQAGADGTATLTVPAGDRLEAWATSATAVRSFPVELRTG